MENTHKSCKAGHLGHRLDRAIDSTYSITLKVAPSCSFSLA